MEEGDEQLLAEKGAIHDFICSSCSSRKKGTRAGHGLFLPFPALFFFFWKSLAGGLANVRKSDEDVEDLDEVTTYM